MQQALDTRCCTHPWVLHLGVSSLAVDMLRHATVRAGLSLFEARTPFFLPSLLHAAFSTDDKERIIRVDRSGLVQPVPHSHATTKQPQKEPESELVRHIKSLIRVRSLPIGNCLTSSWQTCAMCPVAGQLLCYKAPATTWVPPIPCSSVAGPSP